MEARLSEHGRQQEPAHLLYRVVRVHLQRHLQVALLAVTPDGAAQPSATLLLGAGRGVRVREEIVQLR